MKILEGILCIAIIWWIYNVKYNSEETNKINNKN